MKNALSSASVARSAMVLCVLAGVAVVGACRPGGLVVTTNDRPWAGAAVLAASDDGGHLCALSDRAEIERRLEASIFASLPEEHKQMLLRGCGQRATDGRVAVCFAPDTPDQVMQAFRYGVPGIFTPRFQLGSRWGATALTPVAGSQGDPITITYSFVPDGTILPNEYGEGDLPSELFAWLNSLYGNQATWQPLFTSIFNRWSELSGINYVYEASDDGAAFPTADGVAGVRGDVRISAKNIDGNSGILAYNYYPNPTAGESAYGDMVINSFDSFFATTASNSLRFRNVVAHEAGHGLGAAHVCPVQTNKLMEPFAQTAYDGPRQDDIRFAHLNYGDAFEPNDTQATATVVGPLTPGGVTLGAVPAPAVSTASTISLDAVGDVDYYSFTFPTGTSTVVDATLTPLGFVYDDAGQACAGQSGSCCYGVFGNSNGAADFTISLLNSSGTTLESRTFANTGAPINFRGSIMATGTYALRVSSSSISNAPQLYTLTLASSTTPLVVDILSGPGEVSPPNTVMPVQARIKNGTKVLVPTSPVVRYSVNGGPLNLIAMTPMGDPGTYVAGIPGQPCGSTVTYSVRATATTTVTVVAPAGSPPSTSIGVGRTIFADDFEIDRGWTATSAGATSGFWQRVDPNGTAAAPEDDTTPAGTQCYVTGNGAVGESVGTTDLDGGTVTLTSPIINAAGYSNVRVSYNRWYTNVGGGGPGADVFRAEVSTNGGSTWTAAQTTGPGPVDDPNVQTGWRAATWTLASLSLSPTSQLRVRFIAEDADVGSVIEAGIDDFVVTGTDCVGVSVCDSIDFNGDGLFPDSADIDDFLSVFSGGPCSTGTCGDIDFNNDGLYPDTADIDSLLSVFSGGACL